MTEQEAGRQHAARPQAPEPRDALDRYLAIESGGEIGAGTEAGPGAEAEPRRDGTHAAAAADETALHARCDAVMALTPKLAASRDVAWAFEEARALARSRPARQSAAARWYRWPALAWSVAGVASVALLAVIVVTQWPAPNDPALATATTGIGVQGTSPGDSAAESVPPGSVPPGVEDLLARIDPVVLIANQVTVDGRSIALLPFAEELAAVDPDDIAAVAATTDAIYAGLIRQLRSVPGLYVAEPSTAAAYAEAGASPEEIALYLGVRGVVRGSIESDGRTVSLDLRFTDAAREGAPISKSFEGSVGQLAMIERDVTTSLLDALGTASTWSQ